MAPIVICRTAWMAHYRGTHGDKPKHGGDFIAKQGWGGEIYNFLRYRGRYCGYVQVKGNVGIERLGAAPGAESVRGITVVWAARHPQGGVYVVGWYRDAEVYRTSQDRGIDPRRTVPGKPGRLCEWNIRTAVSNAQLLAQDHRTFRLPVRRGLLGMSLITYLDQHSRSQDQLRRRLLKYVDSGATTAPAQRKPRRGGGGWEVDPKRRKSIEDAAIEHVTIHFEKLGYQVKNESDKNPGWDLEARLDKRLLRIEVKGSALLDVRAELTPGEYYQMKMFKDDDYRVCIVTDALGARPRLAVFEWVPESGCWEDTVCGALKITERVGAIVSA